MAVTRRLNDENLARIALGNVSMAGVTTRVSMDAKLSPQTMA